LILFSGSLSGDQLSLGIVVVLDDRVQLIGQLIDALAERFRLALGLGYGRGFSGCDLTAQQYAQRQNEEYRYETSSDAAWLAGSDRSLPIIVCRMTVTASPVSQFAAL